MAGAALSSGYNEISMAQPTTTVTIVSGAHDSGTILLGGMCLVGVSIPTCTSAAFTLRVSSDSGATFQGVYDTTGEYNVPATTGGIYWAVDPNHTIGVDNCLIRSGTGASPVNQSSTITLTLHFRAIR